MPITVLVIHLKQQSKKIITRRKGNRGNKMSKSYREPRIKVVQKSEHEFHMFFDDETEREMEEIKSNDKEAHRANRN